LYQDSGAKSIVVDESLAESVKPVAESLKLRLLTVAPFKPRYPDVRILVFFHPAFPFDRFC
jgi:hypothetical protein